MQKRHGDLLIQKIKKLPKGLKQRKEKVLAYGEITGHSHRLNGAVAVYEDADFVYFDATSPVSLTHEEHNQIDFEVGVYKVTRKREYSPRANRMVLD